MHAKDIAVVGSCMVITAVVTYGFTTFFNTLQKPIYLAPLPTTSTLPPTVTATPTQNKAPVQQPII